MRYITKYLVSSVLFLLIFVPAFSQQESKYFVAIGSTKESAEEALWKKIVKAHPEYHVASHTVLKNRNGKEEYESEVVVDKGIAMIPGIKFTQTDEGLWIAKIEKNKVIPQEVKWIQNNITVNESPHTEYGRSPLGSNKTTTTQRITKRTDIIGPSGRVVKTTPGGCGMKKTTSTWNGKYGYTYRETSGDVPLTETKSEGSGAVGGAIIGTILLGLLLFI